jgi:CubicO group peptidase (beta-lactamase class C family)
LLNKPAQGKFIPWHKKINPMRSLLFSLFLFFGSLRLLQAQLYFPPNSGSQWDTLSAASLGWCPNRIDSLYQLLENNNSKAFILLKDGKIVLEKYFNGHTANLPWYWASAGKSLTAFLVGIAQRENLLSINDSTSKYLGQGWTSCTPAQERKIKIRNQLTMTTGLDDGVSNDDCTIDTCLQYLAEAGTRWAYHNAPYTLLDSVLRSATGRTINLYMNQKVKQISGMDGLYVKQEFNNVFYSSARSMARFGLLILNRGKWNNTEVLGDSNYFNEMVNSSQSINPSYGYLWWLNGKSSFMAPTSQLVFPGSYNPDAPADMFSAAGKNGQFVQVIPSMNMVWIRMGEAPNNNPVPFFISNDIWKKINQLPCTATGITQQLPGGSEIKVIPNPGRNRFQLIASGREASVSEISIFNAQGIAVKRTSLQPGENSFEMQNQPEGLYFLQYQENGISRRIPFLKN